MGYPARPSRLLWLPRPQLLCSRQVNPRAHKLRSLPCLCLLSPHTPFRSGQQQVRQPRGAQGADRRGTQAVTLHLTALLSFRPTLLPEYRLAAVSALKRSSRCSLTTHTGCHPPSHSLAFLSPLFSFTNTGQQQVRHPRGAEGAH